MDININRVGPGTWFLDIRVKRNGKEKRKRETCKGTREQAVARYYQLKNEMEGTPTSEPTSSLTVRTFGDVLKLYRERRPTFSQSDVSKYDKLISALGSVHLEEFVFRFDQYVRLMQKTPSKVTGKLLSGATVNRLTEMVRAAFNVAVDLELIERNPITKSRFPKIKMTPRDITLTDEQEKKLLAVIDRDAPHIAPMVKFALKVPCRRSELVNMKKADLDLANAAIRVRNGTTKNDEGCWKPIPPDMLDYFRTIPPGSEYLFYRVVGGNERHPIVEYRPLGDFKKAWGASLKTAEITNFHFHDTRHISATALVDNGTPEQVVQTVAGWKTPMLRVYYHRKPKRDLKLVKFFPAASGLQVDTPNVANL